MTVSKLNAKSADGSHRLAWAAATPGASYLIQETLDYNALSGWSTVVSGLTPNTLRTYTATHTNSQTTPRWFRISDDGGSTWTYTGGASAGRFDYSYATATDFLPTGGIRIFPISSANKAIYASSTGSDANNGLSPDAPKLSGAGIAGVFSKGDHVYFQRGDTFAAGNYYSNTDNGVSWGTSAGSLFGAYGPVATARPIFVGNTHVSPSFNVNINNSNPTTWWQSLDFVADLTDRHNDFAAGFSNENNWTGIYFYAGSSDNSIAFTGTNICISDCHFANLYYGFQVVGESNTTVAGFGRINGLRTEGYRIEGAFGHGLSGVHQPSGYLVAGIDGWTDTDGVFYRCGHNPAAGDIPQGGTNSGANVTYDATHCNDSTAGGPWSTAPSSTVFTPTDRLIQSTTPGGVPIYRLCSSNTASSCTLAEAWTVNGGATPSAGTAYHVLWSRNTVFKHSGYGQESSSNCTHSNIINHGNDLMLRSGGSISTVLALKCPIGISTTASYIKVNGANNRVATTFLNCFCDGSVEKDTQGTGGSGIWRGDVSAPATDNSSGAVTLNRCIVNNKDLENSTYQAGKPFRLNISGAYTIDALSLIDSVFIGCNEPTTIDDWHKITGALTVNRCVFSQHRNVNGFDRVFISATGGATGDPGSISFSGNIYWSVKTLADDQWFQQGGSVQSRAQWTTKTGDASPTYLSSAPVFTAERRITDYVALVLGNGSHNADASDFFTQQALLNRFGSTDLRYAADQAINYMQQGYANLVAAFATPFTVPVPPTIGVTSSPTSTTLTTSWTDNSWDETGFDAASTVDGVNFVTLSSVAGPNASSGVVTGLASSTLTGIKIRSKSAVGNSDWSAVALGTTSAGGGGGGGGTTTNTYSGIGGFGGGGKRLPRTLDAPPPGMLRMAQGKQNAPSAPRVTPNRSW